MLSVASPGGPISREDLKILFKRFYRADKARAMNGSYGLGLSIAESHMERIWAESENGSNNFLFSCQQMKRPLIISQWPLFIGKSNYPFVRVKP